MTFETKTFADRAKTARFLRGLSQDNLSRKAQCTPETVSRWEKGTSFPRPSKLLRLAASLKVNVLWLAMGEGPMDLTP